ncbi:MAG: hypothetical protein HQK66_00205 [Desulfamplus sp.]|nr:hypothetical protein [Desulfamplus sp.]
MRQISIPARESRGPCWARRLIQHLWQGETYYFQVDSHMRFADNWDQKLISLIKKCNAPKPVISTYPLPLTPSNDLSSDALVEIMPRYFDDHGILHQHSALRPMPDTLLEPEQTFLISAGMLFTHGGVIEEVPYDPFIYFMGEEITFSLRLWTYGYTIYNPNAVIAYHNYNGKTGRPRHWEDQKDWHLLNQKSMKRIGHLLGFEMVSDSTVLSQINEYGLGDERTLSSFEKASEINFRNRTWRGVPFTADKNTG